MDDPASSIYLGGAVFLLIVLAIALFWKSRGVWGWLVLPAVGSTLAPLYLMLGIYEAISLQPLLPRQDPAVVILWIDIVAYTIFLVASAALLFRLYRKAATFPATYVAISIGAIVFVVVDTFLWMIVLGGEVFGAGYFGQTAISIVIAALWILYMQRSARVRATFVN